MSTVSQPLLDEQAIVTRARNGDAQAFGQLVARYGQPILSLCYASTLNPTDAEDLAQDVFVAAWRGLRRFRGESAFSTWLFALARNRCIDRARRNASRPQLAHDDTESLASQSSEEGSRATATAILASAARLSLPLRQALLLRDLQGLSYAEIATLQRVPIGTVRSRISAARAAVADEVSP